MDTISAIINHAIDLGDDYANSLIEALDENQIFRGKENIVELTIAKINSLLQNHTTKLTAYTLILQLLPQCGNEVLDDKGFSWLTTALKTCNQQSPSNAIGAAYKVISNLLRLSTNAAEFYKTITHSVIQRIFESCSKVGQSDQIEALNCMIVCMMTFPGPCGPSKFIVETVAVKFIDATDLAIITRAANCLLLTQSIKSGGEQGQMHRKYFAEYQIQLIYTIHKYFDELFKYYDESFEGVIQEPDCKLKIPELCQVHEPVPRITKIIQRIRNVLQFLNISLVAPYPTVKLIQIDQIITMVGRGLNVNPKMITNQSVVDNLIISVLLPQVHVELFTVLNTLLKVCKGNLRLYATHFLNIYETSLKWTCSGSSIGCRKPYTRLKISIYESIKLFVDSLGRSCLLEDIAETLILGIINDTSSFKNEVTLQAKIDGGRNLSKRAKKKLSKVQNEATNLAQKHANQPKNLKVNLSDEGNAEVCVAALNCAIAILETVGCSLKPTQIRILQQHIVKNCLTLQMNDKTHEHLYYLKENRIALYRTLFSLTVNPHHLAPPPIQYVLRLLTDASNLDVDKNVREVCHKKVLALGKSLRPQRQTLYFDIDSNELDNAVIELRKNLEMQSVENGEESDDEVEIVEVNESLAKRIKIDDQIDKKDQASTIVNAEEELHSYLNGKEKSDEKEKETIMISDDETELLKPQKRKLYVPETREKIQKQEALTNTNSNQTIDIDVERKVEELLEDFVDE